jgi:hypothetical protein
VVVVAGPRDQDHRQSPSLARRRAMNKYLLRRIRSETKFRKRHAGPRPPTKGTGVGFDIVEHGLLQLRIHFACDADNIQQNCAHLYDSRLLYDQGCGVTMIMSQTSLLVCGSGEVGFFGARSFTRPIRSGRRLGRSPAWSSKLSRIPVSYSSCCTSANQFSIVVSRSCSRMEATLSGSGLQDSVARTNVVLRNPDRDEM